jgi:hypothetical protein
VVAPRKPNCGRRIATSGGWSEHAFEAVGIVAVGEIDPAAAGTVRDDPHSIALLGDEVVPDPDAGKLDPLDLCHVMTTAQMYEASRVAATGLAASPVPPPSNVRLQLNPSERELTHRIKAALMRPPSWA